MMALQVRITSTGPPEQPALLWAGAGQRGAGRTRPREARSTELPRGAQQERGLCSEKGAPTRTSCSQRDLGETLQTASAGNDALNQAGRRTRRKHPLARRDRKRRTIHKVRPKPPYDPTTWQVRTSAHSRSRTGAGGRSARIRSAIPALRPAEGPGAVQPGRARSPPPR